MDGVVIILSLFVPSSETSVRIQTKLNVDPCLTEKRVDRKKNDG